VQSFLAPQCLTLYLSVASDLQVCVTGSCSLGGEICQINGCTDSPSSAWADCCRIRGSTALNPSICLRSMHPAAADSSLAALTLHWAVRADVAGLKLAFVARLLLLLLLLIVDTVRAGMRDDMLVLRAVRQRSVSRRFLKAPRALSARCCPDIHNVHHSLFEI